MSQILDSLNNALFQINQTAGQVSQESEKMAMDSQTLSKLRRKVAPGDLSHLVPDRDHRP